MGDVHKSVTMRCGFSFVQLNKCVMWSSVLQRGHSGDAYLSSLILFKYECMVGHLFVLSWVKIQLGYN